jgi:hypothetical protein
MAETEETTTTATAMEAAPPQDQATSIVVANDDETSPPENDAGGDGQAGGAGKKGNGGGGNKKGKKADGKRGETKEQVPIEELYDLSKPIKRVSGTIATGLRGLVTRIFFSSYPFISGPDVRVFFVIPSSSSYPLHSAFVRKYN